MNQNRHPLEFAGIIFFLIISALAHSQYIPLVKQYISGGKYFELSGYTICISSKELEQEKLKLDNYLTDLGLDENKDGTKITLVIKDINLDIQQSQYRDLIYLQGYQLNISPEEIRIQSSSAQGVFYGIQTLLQILRADSVIYQAEIKDWPDLPLRMIMTDPARQHENLEYFKRLIKFCGRYKINFIQLHLTDHETSVIYHPGYPELMHSNAWKKREVAELVKLATENHIKLIPEIESFGHSRMFIRMKDATDYLHQTELMESDPENWIIIDIPGYTNMLCPSSDKAIHYISEMYEKATCFESDYIHIGFDEVDLSNCERCNNKFGVISGPELFQKHLNHCINIAESNYSKIGVWGDMIKKHPEILDSISAEQVVIFDWDYSPYPDSVSVGLFKEREFEVIACPALMCWPCIIIPSKWNYENIERFIAIAREQKIPGVNTTMWVPTRYLTDASWPGIAFAAEQSWGGSHWNNDLFLENFLMEFFRSKETDQFKTVWELLMNSIRGQDIYIPGCWYNEEGIEQSKKIINERSLDIISCKEKITLAVSVFEEIERTITDNKIVWNALITSAKIQLYIFDHILASETIKTGNKWNEQLVEELDVQCRSLLAKIEQDWDRNRFTDDPNKEGLFSKDQHLLYNFKQMHAFHQQILEENN